MLVPEFVGVCSTRKRSRRLARKKKEGSTRARRPPQQEPRVAPALTLLQTPFFLTMEETKESKGCKCTGCVCARVGVLMLFRFAPAPRAGAHTAGVALGAAAAACCEERAYTRARAQ